MLTVNKGNTTDWANMPLDEMALGNAMDCKFTLKSYRLMREEMKETKVDKVYDGILKDILLTMAEIENRGIKVDVSYLDELDTILIKEVEDLSQVLQDLSPIKGFNPNSNMDLAGVLFTSEGFDLQPEIFSKINKLPSITEEHLEKVLITCNTPEACEFIRALLKYKSRCKQHKTYVKGVRKSVDWNEEPRIYSQYNFSTVVTGRLSCSTPTVKVRELNKKNNYVNKEHKKGVSFHTLPRPSDDDPVNIRKLMISEEGKAFVAADYATAELRVLAQCCQDPNLIKAFTGGKDLHKYTASLIYDKPISTITKEERQIAKSVSFLIVYGGGPNKLSQQIGKPIGYCKGIFADYSKAFPKVFSWIKEGRKKIKTVGYATSLFGRRRHLKNVNSPSRAHQERALRQGMNFIIQSSASDLMLHGIERVKKYSEQVGLNLDILASVHDSVEIQCDHEDIKKTAELLKYCLQSTEDLPSTYGFEFLVPFEVDIEVGKSFGDGLEAEFDTSGNLQNPIELLNYVQE